MVILEHDASVLFDADAFLDSDGDLRLKLTYLEEEKCLKTITTGKIKINNIGISNSELNVNISIFPDKSNNLYTVEF